MHRTEKCAKCESPNIVHRAMVLPHYEGGEGKLNLRVDTHPTAIFRKKSVRSSLHAEVCSSCGYVEFYADDPAELLFAYRESQEKVK